MHMKYPKINGQDTQLIWLRGIATSVVLALTGCGGSGSGSDDAIKLDAPMLSGRIADGYINGAIVFWDCNGNMTHDADELSTTSGPGGKYQIAASPTPKAPLLACSLRAKVPAEAIDEDTGAPVGVPYMMSAVNGKPQFISPITTLQNLGVYSEDELKNKFPADAFLPVSTDYIASGDSGRQQHNAAKYIAVALQSVNGLITTGDAQARGDALGRAMAYVPSEAFTKLNATPTTLGTFGESIPQLDQEINQWSATLDRAEFAAIESAFSGPNDPRRQFVQLALESIKNNPQAVIGNRVNWNLVPLSERSVWGSQIIGGHNGFVDSSEVESLQQSLQASTIKAIAEIEAAKNRHDNSLLKVVVKNGAEMLSTSLDSAIKVVPSLKAISKTKGLTSKYKFKKAAAIALDKTKRASVFLIKVGANCTSLVTDLGFGESPEEFTSVSNLLDI